MNIVTFESKLYPLPTKEIGIDKKYKFIDGKPYYFEDLEFAELLKSASFQEGLKVGYFKTITPEETKKVATKKATPKKIEISTMSLEDAKLLTASESKKTQLDAWLKEERANQMRPEIIAILETNLKTGASV